MDRFEEIIDEILKQFKEFEEYCERKIYEMPDDEVFRQLEDMERHSDMTAEEYIDLCNERRRMNRKENDYETD